MTADIRTAARREAERVRFRHKGHDYSANRHYKLGFSEGAVWAVARVTPTREQIAEVIHPGYGRTDGYCASCALAKDQARKIAALFGEVTGDE